MRIGTAERGSTFFTQGEALRSVLQAEGLGEPIEIVESPSASVQNALRLHSREVEFGFMAMNWIGRAQRGDSPFPKPIDLRVAAFMNAGPMFFVTSADSAIRRLSDLRGKRIAIGPESSGLREHAYSMLGPIGIGAGDFEPVYLDLGNGAKALMAREIDAQLQCPMPNKVMTDLDANADIRVIPTSEPELETIIRSAPFYGRAVMSKGSLRGLRESVLQPGVTNVLMTHASVPSTTVAAVVAAILAGASDLERMNPLFSGLKELTRTALAKKSQLIFDGVHAHQGAVRAFDAAGHLA